MQACVLMFACPSHTCIPCFTSCESCLFSNQFWNSYMLREFFGPTIYPGSLLATYPVIKQTQGLSSLLPPPAFSASPAHRLTYLGEAVWGLKWRLEEEPWYRPEGQWQDSMVSCGTQHTMPDQVFTLTLWFPQASLPGHSVLPNTHFLPGPSHIEPSIWLLTRTQTRQQTQKTEGRHWIVCSG